MINKKILVIALVVLSIGTIFAFEILGNGDIILEGEEFAGIADGQIANYMSSSFQMTRHKVTPNDILVYYNITYVEPTHVNDTYKVFRQEKPFKISKTLFDYCMGVADLETCKYYLTEKPSITKLNNYPVEGETLIIKSTYLQASEHQLEQYNRSLHYRDLEIYNKLNDLDELL